MKCYFLVRFPGLLNDVVGVWYHLALYQCSSFVFSQQMMNDHDEDSPDGCIKKVGWLHPLFVAHEFCPENPASHDGYRAGFNLTSKEWKVIGRAKHKSRGINIHHFYTLFFRQ